jgi:hypothetical protein
MLYTLDTNYGGANRYPMRSPELLGFQKALFPPCPYLADGGNTGSANTFTYKGLEHYLFTPPLLSKRYTL